MTDNLPELPEPHHAYQNGVGMDNWAGDYFTADQMRSYALAAIASERARADALEAALQELLQARDAWSGFSDGTIEYIRERDRWYSAINAARSLLEKTNDR